MIGAEQGIIKASFKSFSPGLVGWLCGGEWGRKETIGMPEVLEMLSVRIDWVTWNILQVLYHFKVISSQLFTIRFMY